MATVALSSKAVGSTVKLKVNGTAKNFIVVHQGKPGSMYDASCDGTWLLMQDCYESRQWHSSNNNDYENSTIDNYLNTTFLNLFESNIRDAIKQVKIPYRKGAGYGKTVTSGSSGLSTKIFLLSSTEVNLVHGYEPTNEGACLSYFSGTAQNGADNKRVAKLNGSATGWWLRSPYCFSSHGSSFALLVLSGGNWGNNYCSNSDGIRPALVLPTSLLVSDDGSVQTNTAPTISSPSGNSGVNLGSKAAAFNFQYTPSDADGDKLTVTEKLDGVTKKTRSNVTSGTQLTFECASTAAEFQKILNGSHTITIEVSDGQEKATFTATFTKAVTQATITLDEPLAVEGDITVAILAVTGEIPVDADYTVEVTNNAKDSSPVWQDATTEVKNGTNIVFENHTNTNGAAFNFRITVKRGSSNTGGYISGVSGAFQ